MKSHIARSARAIALPAMVAALHPSGASLRPAIAAELAPKNIIAAQIRKQGFACSKALSARPDSTHPEKSGGWVLTCRDAIYHIHLVPHRAAEVERVDQRNNSPRQ